MRHVTARLRLPAALVLLVSASAAASAAIAPWYPRDGEDTCRVLTGAAPRVETPPPPWQIAILRPPGWVGQDPRVYFVPPVLDCRPGSAHANTRWACAPTFLPWAKKNCAGLQVRE